MFRKLRNKMFLRALKFDANNNPRRLLRARWWGHYRARKAMEREKHIHIRYAEKGAL